MEDFVITFEQTNLAKSNVYANELKSRLKQEDSSLELVSSKSSDKNMDLGALITIVLSSPVLIAFIKGLTKYLIAKNNISLEITNKKKTFKISGINYKNIKALEKKLMKYFNNEKYD